RFAGTVFPQQRVNLAAVEREIDIVEGGYAEEALADGAGFEKGRGFDHVWFLRPRTGAAPAPPRSMLSGGGHASGGVISSRGPFSPRRPSSGHPQRCRAWIPSGSTSAAPSCPSGRHQARRRRGRPCSESTRRSHWLLRRPWP